MELIRLEFQSFRDFAETAWPGLGRDGLWAPPGAPLPEDLEEVRLEVGLAEGSPLLRGIVRVEPEEGTGRAFLRFLELDRPSRVLLERIEAKQGRAVLAGPDDGSVRPSDALVIGASSELASSEPSPPGVGEVQARRRPRLTGDVEGAEDSGPATAGEEDPPKPPDAPARAAPEALPSQPETPLWTAEEVADLPSTGSTDEPPPGPTAVEAHTLEELADLLAGQDRQEALAQTQRIPPVRADRAGEAPPERAPRGPAPSLAEPEPLPPYLGGPDPNRRKIVVVRSPWLWIVVMLGLLVGAWGLGRGLRLRAAAPAVKTRPAGPADAASADRRPAVAASFDRVEAVDWRREGSSTVVTVRVNGPIGRERWSTERVEGDGVREILHLHDVSASPPMEVVEIGGPVLIRLRLGLHLSGEQSALQVVAELADPAVRLAGVDVRDRSLRLIFVRG